MASSDTTIWSLVEAAAEDHPDRVLLSDEHGRSFSAAGVRDAAESVAAGLGVTSGDVVSWQLPTVAESVVLMLALARAGATQNPIIPILREREVGHIVSTVGTTKMIVPETWRGFGHGDLARRLGDVNGYETIVVDLEGETGKDLRLPQGDPTSLPGPPTSADDVRWLYFTSGTTSMPKGVQHSDRTLVGASLGVTEHMDFGDGDVYPIAWPISHIGGIGMVVSGLRCGGNLVMFDRFDPANIAERMATVGPTMLGTGVPFFRAYLDGQRRHGAEPLFPDLRLFVAGGAPTPPEIIDELREVFGLDLVLNAYGLTEFPIAASPRPTDPSDKLRRTVGQLSPGVEVRFVDDEIRLKGPQCFVGYAGDTDAGSSGGGPFDEDGWFRTGDLGHLDEDGYLYVTGRLKDIIIRNAENISAGEVEETLLRHAEVVDVTVLGMPNERTGEHVCAVVVLAAGATAGEAVLSAHCAAQDMARQKIPEQYVFVDAIERNPMGKVVKADLRRRLVAGGHD